MMMMHPQRRLATVMAALAFTLVAPLANGAELPTTHDYQKVLRGFLASLQETDLHVEITPFGDPPGDLSFDEKHRLWTLRMLPPPFDVGLPAEQFLLKTIEAGDPVQLPAMSPEGTAWLAAWDHPSNPYHGVRALKLRAFVWAAADMIMLDAHHEAGGGRRSDFLGGTLIWLAYTYLHAKDVLPQPVQAAYEQGLRKFFGRLETWGPTGAMTDMDLFAPVGMWYAAQAIGDPDLHTRAENYARPLFTHPKYFHPAGYFVDVGAFDATYNGISLYFASHAAAATGWDFTIDAIGRAYELRSYLHLPEPEGRAVGPAHFSPRTSGGTPQEQWNRAVRHIAAAMVSDKAMYRAPRLTEEQLDKGIEEIFSSFNRRNQPRNANPQPWKESHWSSDINFLYENYQESFAQRIRDFAEQHPERLTLPFRRDDAFIRNFNDVFLIAKRPSFGVVVHTGPIGRPAQRVYGFSGGALSAFWTESTGAVLLGRRSGSQGRARPDDFSNWRTWPHHGATGIIPNGRVITTSRLQKPNVEYQVTDDSAVVQVSGALKNRDGAMDDTLVAPIDYRRRFELTDDGLTITTELTGAGENDIQELYETLPVFYGFSRDPSRLADRVRIELRHEDQWTPATTDPQTADAIRIRRYEGNLLIELDQSRPVQLSPEFWQDHYQSSAVCRSLMIDLLPAGERPVPLRSATVRYTIRPGDPATP